MMALTTTSRTSRDVPGSGGMGSDFVPQDELRSVFALAMSAMYKAEVPQYSQLVDIVGRINKQKWDGTAGDKDEMDRLTVERHGAIRLGTAKELQTVGRIFSILGMQAVGYYDLSVAGLPMHATCFRPVDSTSLSRNPFRVFTTLLRPDHLMDEQARKLGQVLLQRRNIFSAELLEWLKVAENQGGHLRPEQAEAFIPQALQTFGWRPVAAATRTEYLKLREEHPILADIACFQSAHINHLTPRVLDITAAQEAMIEVGMAVKSTIEGPPERKCPILLRQTSFLALEEQIQFKSVEGDEALERLVSGSHKARFGEIEQRGAAVTPAGRRLYDKLLRDASVKASGARNAADRNLIVKDVFAEFPDTWDELREQRLAYFEYKCVANTKPANDLTLWDAVKAGLIRAVPIVYEDFLPFSAAGIFQSNLQAASSSHSSSCSVGSPDLRGFEKSLNGPVLDADELYQRIENASIARCAKQLGQVW